MRKLTFIISFKVSDLNFRNYCLETHLRPEKVEEVVVLRVSEDLISVKKRKKRARKTRNPVKIRSSLQSTFFFFLNDALKGPERRKNF